MAQNKVILWVVVILIILVGGYFLITAPAQETGPIKIGAPSNTFWGRCFLG